jgi:hypothetical protein
MGRPVPSAAKILNAEKMELLEPGREEKSPAEHSER